MSSTRTPTPVFTDDDLSLLHELLEFDGVDFPITPEDMEEVSPWLRPIVTLLEKTPEKYRRRMWSAFLCAFPKEVADAFFDTLRMTP